MRRALISLVAVGVFGCGLAFLSGRAGAAERDVTALNSSHTCSNCHVSHNGDGPNLLIATDVEVLCLSCHGPGGTSILKARNHKGQTCLVCHNPHDGEFNRYGNRNLKMMRAQVVPKGSGMARPLVFESRGTDLGQPVLRSFCDDDLDNDGAWDNACDTCHSSSPDFHRYTAPSSHGHRTGRTCTVCHDHYDGFQDP